MDFDAKEILESFALEVAEHIQYANDCILLMEEERDEEAINGLFRVLHTVKGNALMLGFDRLGKLAHTAESLVAKLRSKAMIPSKQIIDLMFSVLDTIEAMTKAALAEAAEPPGVDALMDILTSVAEGSVIPQNARLEVRQATLPPVVPGAAEKQDPVRASPVAAGFALDPGLAGDTVAGMAAGMAADMSAEPGVGGQFPPRPLKMLVVEDEFISRKMLTGMLQPYGSCDVAVDGMEALAAFGDSIESDPYDFVFLDIMMPKMDGFEATKQMRALEMHKAMRKLKESGKPGTNFSKHDTVIVITSSLDDPEHYFNACYRCGANTYLVKPVNHQSIQELMTKYSSLLK